MKNYLPMKRVCRKLADFSTRPGVLLDRSCECLLHIISKPVWQLHGPGKRGLRQPIYGTVAWCGHRRRSHLNGLRYALTEVSNNIVACFFLGIDACRCQKHPKDSKSILESVLHSSSSHVCRPPTKYFIYCHMIHRNTIIMTMSYTVKSRLPPPVFFELQQPSHCLRNTKCTGAVAWFQWGASNEGLT